jgi:DNA replication ATP-dependent helicase Dna2
MPHQNNNFKVIGSTIASSHLSRGLNGGELFDVVIIDEAGASTVPQALLALRHGKKFILVGDHYQLPPILQVDSKKTGLPAEPIEYMKISMFEHLVERWPNFLSTLNTQYRMDEKIAELSNILVYNEIGKLKTGTNSTRNYLPYEDTLSLKAPNIFAESNNELRKILCRNFPLIWLNVEGKHKWDQDSNNPSKKGSAYNILEVDVIEGIFKLLKRLVPELENENIGIIASYRKQVEKLNERFSEEILNGLEINTVDSFQGKEKDIIIFSTVYAPRGLKRKNKGTPLIFKDKRRFNVAFTRAKYKLIMVGDVELVRRDVNYFQDAYKYIRDAYGDPNNYYFKKGIINDYNLCEYLQRI